MSTRTGMRVAVVGLGSIGLRHARLIAERADMDLVLCDPAEARRVEAAQAMPGVALVDSVEAALAANPGIVLVCTPNRFHRAVGLRALAAGARVLVEKPIADSLEDGRALVEAARKAKVSLAVGYMMRFDPGLQRIRGMIADGTLGTIVAARAMIGTYTTLLCARNNDRETQPNSLIVDYTHELDYLAWLLGPIRSAMAMAAQRGSLEKQARPNVAQMVFETESGALASVHMDYVQHPQRRTLEVIGDKGSVAYDFMTGQWRHFRLNVEDGGAAADLAPLRQRVDDLYRGQLADMAGAGNGSVATGEEACQALKAAEAVIESVRTERKIRI